MGAAFDDSPLVEHQHFVERIEPDESVGDEQRGTTFGQREQVGRQGIGGGGVEVFPGSSRTRIGKSASSTRASARR